MTSLVSRRIASFVVIVAFAVVQSQAAELSGTKYKYGEYNPADTSVELFDGIKSGDLEAKFIPKDSTQARIFITNKTKKPLNVKLPSAFGGVPVLAQGARAGYGAGGSTIGQNVGGGLGGGGLGGGAAGGGAAGGGFFNIPAEKVGEIKGECVCLEHGKPEPRPNMKYEIRPIEEVTDKPEVQELCKMLGKGQISQVAAQAAAWHLNNAMSWEQLAAKRIERSTGESYPYFAPLQLKSAMALAEAAEKASQEPTKVEGQSLVSSPGDTAK